MATARERRLSPAAALWGGTALLRPLPPAAGGVRGAGTQTGAMTYHGAQKVWYLRENLELRDIMTTAQVRREGLMPVRQTLRLPQVTYTVTTRTTQQTSQRTLTFVALEEATLRQYAPSELGHLCGLGEGLSLLRRDENLALTGLTNEHSWRLVQPEERRQGNRERGVLGCLPDAEILSPEGYLWDWAVEMDAGYPMPRKKAKLRAFAQDGYAHIVWVTSVHGLVNRIVDVMIQMHRDGELGRVRTVTAVLGDYWSDKDPYGGERRCKTKRFIRHHRF